MGIERSLELQVERVGARGQGTVGLDAHDAPARGRMARGHVARRPPQLQRGEDRTLGVEGERRGRPDDLQLDVSGARELGPGRIDGEADGLGRRHHVAGEPRGIRLRGRPRGPDRGEHEGESGGRQGAAEQGVLLGMAQLT